MAGRVKMQKGNGSNHLPRGAGIRPPSTGWSDSKDLAQVWQLLRNIRSGDSSKLAISYSGGGITITPIEPTNKKIRRASAAAASVSSYEGPFAATYDGSILSVGAFREPVSTRTDYIYIDGYARSSFTAPETIDFSSKLNGNYTVFYDVIDNTEAIGFPHYNITLGEAISPSSTVAITPRSFRFHVCNVEVFGGSIVSINQVQYGAPSLTSGTQGLFYSNIGGLARIRVQFVNMPQIAPFGVGMVAAYSGFLSDTYIYIRNINGGLSLGTSPSGDWAIAGLIRLDASGNLLKYVDYTSTAYINFAKYHDDNP